jgi:TonB-linked SusC/RagA family outer membrane protein
MKRLCVFLACFVFVGVSFLQAQTVQITGTVSSADDGMPIPGASIQVKGTTIGVSTDLDGKYTLNVPQTATTLVFSFVGLKTQEIEIQGRSVINVTLATDALALDEIVVTALGISRERKALGYSVQDIGGAELARANTTDVVNSLAARTSGVQINSSAGTAGASTYITIRGASSLTGNNQPLFVIDGVPINTSGGGGSQAVDGVAESSRSIDINPDDIESMSILKGGAATALYGIQAANGAVIITTKKGKKGFQVEFTSSVMLSQISQTYGMQNTFAQGNNGVWLSGYNGAWGPRMDGMVYSKDPSVWERPLMDVSGALVPKGSISESSPFYGGEVKPFNQYDFFQTGISYNNNLNIRAGNDNTTYYFSLGHRSEEGVVPNNTFTRTSFRLNAETKVTSKVTTGGGASYVNSGGNFIQQGSNVSGVMLGLLRTPPSFDNSAGYKLANGTQRTYRNGGGYDNPYWTANENFWDENVHRLMGNAFVDYAATSWLTIKYKLGTDFFNREYKNAFAVNSRARTAGYVMDFMNKNQIVNSDLIASIVKNVTDDINFNLVLGNNMYQTTYVQVAGEANGLSIPGFYDIGNTGDQKAYYYSEKMRSAAFFYDLNVGFKNMLYLGTTGRYEWSTTMPADNLARFYPSANLSFIFTELPMLKGNEILSFGKLRGSYAITANYALPYSTVMTYGVSSAGDGWTDGIVFPLGGTNAYTNSYTMYSDDLTHETMTTTEFGIELHFLKKRFGIDAAYFKNVNQDLLMSVPIARSTGYGYKYMNIGVMESYGYEISAFATPVKARDFQWDIFANFTSFKNPVKKLADGVENLFLGGFVDPQIRAVAGEEYRSIYGYDYYRDANGNLLINNNPNDNYRDGFPMTNSNDMISLGTVNPDWTANITNTFTYKGFLVSALLDIKKGGKMYNGTRFTMNSFGTSIETSNREVVYNPDGTINLDLTPAKNIVRYNGVLGYIDSNGNVVSDGTPNNIYVVNDAAWYIGQGGNFGGGPTIAAIESTDWIRLREVTVAYQLGKGVMSKLPFTNAEVYFTGRNLWLSTPYTGIDPETSLLGSANGQGMDYFNMPGTKTYTFGLKLGF